MLVEAVRLIVVVAERGVELHAGLQQRCVRALELLDEVRGSWRPYMLSPSMITKLEWKRRARVGHLPADRELGRGSSAGVADHRELDGIGRSPERNILNGCDRDTRGRGEKQQNAAAVGAWVTDLRLCCRSLAAICLACAILARRIVDETFGNIRRVASGAKCVVPLANAQAFGKRGRPSDVGGTDSAADEFLMKAVIVELDESVR